MGLQKAPTQSRELFSACRMLVLSPEPFCMESRWLPSLPRVSKGTAAVTSRLGGNYYAWRKGGAGGCSTVRITGTLGRSSQSPLGQWASHDQRAQYYKATRQGQWRDCAQLEGFSIGGSTNSEQGCGVELKFQLCVSGLLDVGPCPSLLYQFPHLKNGLKRITTSQAADKNDVCK